MPFDTERLTDLNLFYYLLQRNCPRHKKSKPNSRLEGLRPDSSQMECE